MQYFFGCPVVHTVVLFGISLLHFFPITVLANFPIANTLCFGNFDGFDVGASMDFFGERSIETALRSGSEVQNLAQLLPHPSDGIDLEMQQFLHLLWAFRWAEALGNPKSGCFVVSSLLYIF